MIRTPLRPLARILDARNKGENPDAIERENIRIRHAFAVVGARMGLLATSEPMEPRASAPGAVISAARADIVDRKGRILATNLDTHAVYAQPHHMIEPIRAADELVKIFPDLERDRLIKDFSGTRKFLWIKKKISPEQMQAVHEIGDPGEVIGVAGAEKYFDNYLRDPANAGRPLQLSLDMTVQAAAERVLYGGMKLLNAKGATSVLMDVQTGEVISVVSLPDFDPNDRPRPLTSGDQADSPLFNRSVEPSSTPASR